MSEAPDEDTAKNYTYTIKNIVEAAARNLSVKSRGNNAVSMFKNLIDDAKEKYGNPAVVIIDEYDNPLLNVVDNKEEFEKVRNLLRNFYKVVEMNEKNLRITFITGITKFAQMSVFSALNNLTDITLDPEYTALLGITQEELEKDFADYIDKWAKEYGGKKNTLIN